MAGNERNQSSEEQAKWWNVPVVKAVASIAGVGVSLAGLLIVVFFAVMAGIQQPERNDDMPPSSPSYESTINGPGNLSTSSTRVPGTAPVNGPANQRENVALPPAQQDAGAQVVRVMSASDLTDLVRASRIEVVGVVEVSTPVYMVANEVALSDGAAILGSQIVVFSEKLSGGTLDVSGRGDRTDAGSIYVATNHVDGTNFKAVGGRGGRGSAGAAGKRGRNGDCSGFGGYRANSRGGNGAPGGRGRPGGTGGKVEVVYGMSIEIGHHDVRGGQGGPGAPGGSPGRGGAGCTGLVRSSRDDMI